MPLEVKPYEFYAMMKAADSGSPTHTSAAGYQKVGAGGGTLTWTSVFDVRPPGVSAQVDTATNKRINIKQSGVYMVTAGYVLASMGTQSVLAIYVNGASVHQTIVLETTGNPSMRCAIPMVLASGDYVELYAWQGESASEAYLTSAIYAPWLSVQYIGPST